MPGLEGSSLSSWFLLSFTINTYFNYTALSRNQSFSFNTSCDLQFFDDIIDDDDNAEQLTSQIICGDNELEPACFSPENQAVL